MSIVWIIEPSENPSDSLANRLMGDFAVRAFASMDSFQRLARFNRKMLPSTIIVDGDRLAWSLERVGKTLDYFLPETLRILVSNDFDTRSSADNSWRVLSRSLEGMMLSSFIARDLHERSLSNSMRNVVRYRDVVFDISKCELRTIDGEAAHMLSRKESAILQMFLERPGACVSRDEIQQRVWDGLKVAPRNIDSHVSRLRKRFTNTEIGIRSVYGGGYILK